MPEASGLPVLGLTQTSDLMSPRRGQDGVDRSDVPNRLEPPPVPRNTRVAAARKKAMAVQYGPTGDDTLVCRSLGVPYRWS